MTLIPFDSQVRTWIGPRSNYGALAVPAWAYPFEGASLSDEVYNQRFSEVGGACINLDHHAWILTPTAGQRWKILCGPERYQQKMRSELFEGPM